MTKFIFVLSLLTGFSSFAQNIPSTPEELRLAPLLDLHNGGISGGAAQGTGPTAGVILNATALPKAGDGFKNMSGAAASWGSGEMISLLVNSAPVMAQQFPGNVMDYAAIAQEHGGAYGPHKSHQNGLDADIWFVGETKYGSVLDKDGVVTDRFDHEKNWFYWRLITSQQILFNRTPETAVSMILVDPRIKTHLCAWAKGREASLDALDYQVLNRLRPTEGHDDHFHVRLKCSPFYPDCIGKAERIPKKLLTGCAEFDGPAPVSTGVTLAVASH